MHQVRVEEAKEELVELLDAAIQGEEVVILRDDWHAVQLVPVEPPRRRPQFGSARGMVVIAEDFDAPVADFNEYMR
jgi:antitoxin (DNA-binding transcriptional repressor) of toxin-antitoxin stability system